MRYGSVATNVGEWLAFRLGQVPLPILDTVLGPMQARALMAAGDDAQARQVLRQGCDWIQATARDHVPAAFREGFTHRNPIHRTLLALHARWAT